jgi:hypothetical protein
MIRYILTLVLISCLAQPATALGQENEEGEADGSPVLVVSSFKCDWAELGTINSNWQEYWLPVFQELVDEGMIDTSGIYYHMWGDEWNVNWYTVSKDIPSFLAAYEEGFRRIGERYPEAPEILDYCTEHKDGFYQLGPRTGPIGNGG